MGRASTLADSSPAPPPALRDQNQRIERLEPTVPLVAVFRANFKPLQFLYASLELGC